MKDIKEIIYSLRSEVNLYRNDRKNLYVLPDILAVEIAISLTEFALKRDRALLPNEEIWFQATYPIAHSFDGTEREKIYILYKELINYVEANGYFRKNIPKIQWES
jgi:hypothetical protein